MTRGWPQDIAELPAKDYFVTLIGEFAVRKGGAYEFCAPNKDGSAHTLEGEGQEH